MQILLVDDGIVVFFFFEVDFRSSAVEFFDKAPGLLV